LRRDTQTLAKLREQIAILWGNLEELKLAALQNQQPFPTSEATSAEDMGLSNLPFYCCIKEYGQELDEEDRSDEFSTYATLYALASTRIFESGAPDASNWSERVYYFMTVMISFNFHHSCIVVAPNYVPTCSLNDHVYVNHLGKAQALFFISLRAAMTSMGLVLPVAFWTAGSYELSASLVYMAPDVTYVKSHEDIVKLKVVNVWKYVSKHSKTNLLITNSEFALGLLVGVGKGLELLDGLALQDRNAKLDVALGVLMARL
jgi:hypothetical protein